MRPESVTFKWSLVARFLGGLLSVLLMASLLALILTRSDARLALYGLWIFPELAATGILTGIVSRVAGLNWPSSLVLFALSGVGCVTLVFGITSEPPFGDVTGPLQWGLFAGMPMHLVLGSIIRGLRL
jgi:hypothetical protein